MSELRRFLTESWELGQWSYRQPDRLQTRMNEWALYRLWSGEDVTFGDILFFRASRRFVANFIALILLQLPPLLLFLIGRGASLPVTLLLLGGTVVASYLVALRHLRWALPLPWLATLFYMVWPGAGQRSLDEIMLVWPWAQMMRGWTVGYLLAAGLGWLAWTLAQRGLTRQSNQVLVGGALVAGLIGGWIGTHSLLAALVAAGCSTVLAAPLARGQLARPLAHPTRARLVGWVVAFAVGVPLAMGTMAWWAQERQSSRFAYQGAGEVVALLVGLVVAGALTYQGFRGMPTQIKSDGAAARLGLRTALASVFIGSFGAMGLSFLYVWLIEWIAEMPLAPWLVVAGIAGLLVARRRHTGESVALALFLALLAVEIHGAGALLTLPFVAAPTWLLARFRPRPLPGPRVS